MKHQLVVPLIVMIISWAASAYAQQNGEEKKDGELDATFASMSREVGVVCGEYLPNQIPGITELMALCGGRIGLKVSDGLFFEPQLLAGAGHAQRYVLGSGSIRGDFQLEDFVISSDIGADIHYATQPIPTGGEQTNIYFGGHIGGSIWFEFSKFFALRTDMQFFLNPGTSLFVGLAMEIRFSPEANQGNQNQQ
jgi:hypothetical protein